jgi:hypothetical protein
MWGVEKNFLSCLCKYDGTLRSVTSPNWPLGKHIRFARIARTCHLHSVLDVHKYRPEHYLNLTSRLNPPRLSICSHPVFRRSVISLPLYVTANGLCSYTLLCLSELTRKAFNPIQYHTVFPMKPRLGMEVYLHSFLTSALNGMNVKL